MLRKLFIVNTIQSIFDGTGILATNIIWELKKFENNSGIIYITW